jgi:hypothetical protein
MTNFDADILCELRDLQEVAIRTEKHPKAGDLRTQASRARPPRGPCTQRPLVPRTERTKTSSSATATQITTAV